VTSQRRARLTLLLVAAAFLTPFALALVLRFGGWQPNQTRNVGELLQPPLPLHAVRAQRADSGQAWTFVNTEQQWTLLAQLPVHCDPACRSALEVLPKVRTALARHAPRLHPFVLDAEGGPQPFPTLRLGGDVPQLLAERPLAGVQVWLVDPHGFLVLRYREGFDPSGLRKDLSRLIR
jgi:hypothetical protein